ncbi:tropomyosin-2 [Coemansia javaensis]|uniref:Tropomyosin-2 n=1 Tax=Coemansia javaensis TaxID=2761396 RepID=A0A9W8LIW7_9FUNG|nr:tropomyosin-2 [Coemansia javaensis]
MDKLREKIASLRAEIDAAVERAETAEQALKQLTDQQTERDQEVISYQNRIKRLEEEAQVREEQLDEAKQIQRDSEATLNESDAVLKKASSLEEKLDETENQLREALERQVRRPGPSLGAPHVIRNYDLENENLERINTQLKKDMEAMELKYEEVSAKYKAAKDELDETIKTLESI